MYFARLCENFMSICDKNFHFVFNITGNTSSDFLQKLHMSGEVFFASRACQGKVYSIRASISPQSPSSLDPVLQSTYWPTCIFWVEGPKPSEDLHSLIFLIRELSSLCWSEVLCDCQGSRARPPSGWSVVYAFEGFQIEVVSFGNYSIHHCKDIP